MKRAQRFFIHLVTGHTWRLALMKKMFCRMLLSPQAVMLVLTLRPTQARFCVVWFWGLSFHKSEATLLMPHSESGNNSATWNWKHSFCWNACPHGRIKNRISFRCWGKWMPQHCCPTVSCYHMPSCYHMFSFYLGRVQSTFVCQIMYSYVLL